MSFFRKRRKKKRRNPALAPWPPGVDFRVIYTAKLGAVGQLRPGAALPRYIYMKERNKLLNKAKSCICLN